MFLESNIRESGKSGWIEVICGSMFSGKTEELIRRVRRAQFAKQQVEIFKPAVDVRYEESEVVSHNRNILEATPVDSAYNILLLAADCEVVGIDEAQFFDEGIVEVANKLANQGKRVIIAELDMDYLGRPFGPMPDLMATAEYVTKVHAICVKTGNLAHYTHRKSGSDKLVELGAAEEYEPLSRRAYNEARKEEEEQENQAEKDN